MPASFSEFIQKYPIKLQEMIFKGNCCLLLGQNVEDRAYIIKEFSRNCADHLCINENEPLNETVRSALIAGFDSQNNAKFIATLKIYIEQLVKIKLKTFSACTIEIFYMLVELKRNHYRPAGLRSKTLELNETKSSDDEITDYKENFHSTKIPQMIEKFIQGNATLTSLYDWAKGRDKAANEAVTALVRKKSRLFFIKNSLILVPLVALLQVPYVKEKIYVVEQFLFRLSIILAIAVNIFVLVSINLLLPAWSIFTANKKDTKEAAEDFRKQQNDAKDQAELLIQEMFTLKTFQHTDTGVVSINISHNKQTSLNKTEPAAESNNSYVLYGTNDLYKKMNKLITKRANQKVTRLSWSNESEDTPAPKKLPAKKKLRLKVIEYEITDTQFIRTIDAFTFTLDKKTLEKKVGIEKSPAFLYCFLHSFIGKYGSCFRFFDRDQVELKPFGEDQRLTGTNTEETPNKFHLKNFGNGVH